MFLEISRKLIKKETLTQVFSCEFREISKNAFFHRTPLVATSDGCESSFKTSRKHWWCSPNVLTFRRKSAVSRKKKNFFVGIVQSILHNFGNSYSEYIFQTNLMLVKNEI